MPFLTTAIAFELVLRIIYKDATRYIDHMLKHVIAVREFSASKVYYGFCCAFDM